MEVGGEAPKDTAGTTRATWASVRHTGLAKGGAKLGDDGRSVIVEGSDKPLEFTLVRKSIEVESVFGYKRNAKDDMNEAAFTVAKVPRRQVILCPANNNKLG